MTEAVVILMLLINGEISSLSFPFHGTVSECFDRGDKIIETISTYRGPGPNQGWYLNSGQGIIFGFICE